jgi:hypothetical protein
MRDFASQQSTWSATWPEDDDDLSFRMYVVWCAILPSPSLNNFAVTLYACGIFVEPWRVAGVFSNDRQDNLAGLVRDMDTLDILIYSLFPSTLLARSFLLCLLLSSLIFTTRILDHGCWLLSSLIKYGRLSLPGGLKGYSFRYDFCIRPPLFGLVELICSAERLSTINTGFAKLGTGAGA